MKRAAKETRGPLERAARDLLRETARVAAKLERQNTRAVAEAAEAMMACLEGGNSIYFCGNGGSAADAQHLAAELAGRYLLDRPALPATALSTNSSSLTAIGNDFGYEQVFSRQLEGLGMPGDVLVAITTSGNSPNVLKAVEAAHARGMVVIGMTGLRGRRLIKVSDVALVSPSDQTPHIQEAHIAMGHAVCELVERALFGGRRQESHARAGKGAARRTRPAKARRRSASR